MSLSVTSCGASSTCKEARHQSVVDMFREAMTNNVAPPAAEAVVPRFTRTGPQLDPQVFPEHLIPFISKCTVVTLIPGRYLWVSVNKAAYKALDSSRKYLQGDANGWCYICTDSEYEYQVLGKEFGPYDLALTHRYISDVCGLLDTGRRVVHFCASKNSFRAASACLASLCITYRGDVTGAQAAQYFNNIRLEPFRDANLGASSFDLTLEHVCGGFEFAVREGWFDLETFDRKAWEHYQQLPNGDMNWIVPARILAFAGPSDTLVDEQGQEVCHPDLYVKTFSTPDFGVSTVVRLNERRYSPDFFTQHGIRHYDLNFEDGSCPSDEVVKRFFAIVDSSEGAVAVHCKAGLGRTGTLIGLWAMREYGLTAPQFIGWCRLCRPGSILGPQQAYLLEMEAYCHSGRASPHNPQWVKLGSESSIGRNGDLGQASRLLRSKRLNSGELHSSTTSSVHLATPKAALDEPERKRKSASSSSRASPLVTV